MGTDHSTAIQSVKELATLAGGHAFTMHQVGRVFGDAGIPDMCVVLRANGGRGPWAFAWVEIKVGRDQLRPAQIAFRAVMALAGVRVIVGTAGDVADAFGYS